MHDAELVTVSKKEKRALITRDLELYKQATAKGIDALYLEGQTGEEKLAEVARRFGISLNVNMAKSRCSKCNVRVKPIPKENVADKVENSTYAHYDEFWQCPKCGQIYWQGAHWTRIRRTLEKAMEHLNPTGC
jgi:uncharacterized protein with PIN domain